MAADVYTIGRTSLEVGQWIQFTAENLKDVSEEQKAIYQKDQRYLVISREDIFLDPCRCYLVDMAGKRYDYYAKAFSLKLIPLIESSKIQVVSRESVESIHGAQKVQAVYEAALKHLEELSDYFAKYPAQTLGQSNLSESQVRQLRRANEILEEKAQEPNADMAAILGLSMAAKARASGEECILS